MQKVRPGMQVKAEPDARRRRSPRPSRTRPLRAPDRPRRLPPSQGRRPPAGRLPDARRWPSSIRRPIVAIVISILMVLMGVSPSPSSPSSSTRSSRPHRRGHRHLSGASAVAVEQSSGHADRAGGQRRATDMIYMQSSNTSDGRMQLDVNFEVGVDQDTANVLTQNRVASAQARLPQEVIAQGVTDRRSRARASSCSSRVYSPERHRTTRTILINYCGINLRDQLLRIPGIAQVDLFGGTDYGMRIWLRPDKLAKLGIDAGRRDLSRSRSRTCRRRPGRSAARPTPKDQRVHLHGRPPRAGSSTAEEFENIIIRETEARVPGAHPGRGARGPGVAGLQLLRPRSNGKPAGSMAVYLLPGRGPAQGGARASTRR